MKRDDKLSAPVLKALDAAGARLFRSTWRANPKHEAQEHLQGRTHYADDDTLRYFHARILSVDLWVDGAVAIIRESTALDHQNRRRGQRFVAFDVWGEVLQRDSLEDCKTTEAAAFKQFAAWAESFDLEAHYREKLAAKQRRAAEEAAAVALALSEKCEAE